MKNISQYILSRLFEMQDLKYKDFHCTLMPTVDPSTVIGVRTPVLRAFAKELYQLPETEVFLHTLPHTYYDENNLHGFLISMEKDYRRTLGLLDRFLPYVDNWATCDLIRPLSFKKHPPELPQTIDQWIASNRTYTIRFGIKALMTFYLDEFFLPEYPELVCSVKSQEYYVNMMIAWYFSTGLAKQYDSILPYLQTPRLDKWTHNKAIQKAMESYRITNEQKEFLRTLKIK